MVISTETIKELRQRTGAGVLDCKNALQEADGDMDGAAEVLRVKGLAAAAKKASRAASDGRVEAYLHTGSKLGVLVEVNCETDFVARTAEYKALCHDLAMQVAAAAPRWVSPEDVPAEEIANEKRIYREQIAGQGKPERVVEHIIDGKLAKFYEDNCLLEQAYIRDGDKTVRQLITEAITKLGENIVVRRFARFRIGD